MKKFVGLVIVGAVIFLWLIKAPILSWYLSNKMKVPVSVSMISIWPKETTISGFSIHNPSGFKDRKAFAAKKIRADYELKKVMADNTEIDRIQVDHALLLVDCANPVCSDNNWTAISSGMPPSSGKSKGSTTIHKLVINDLTIRFKGIELMKATGALTNTVKLPDEKHFDTIEFNEINTAEGFPTDQLIHQIFDKAGLNDYLQKSIQKQVPSNLFNKGFGK